MKSLYNIIFLFLFLTRGFFLTYAQENIEELFSNREYDKIIELLTAKQSSEELTFNEYYILSRSYGRTKRFGNGYVLANEFVKKANAAKDTLHLLKAFNVKAEHLTDLLKVEEGAKFCDSITPFFREKDSVQFMSLCFKCGVLYNYNGQPKKAYAAYKKITRPAYQKLNLYTNNFAIILQKLGRHKEAIVYLKQSLAHNKKKTPFQNPSINIQYSNIGLSYLNTGNYEKSKIYLDSAYNSLTPFSELHNKKSIFNNYYLLYAQKNNTTLMRQYLDSVLAINEQNLKNQIDEQILSITSANKKEMVLTKRVKLVNTELNQTKENILKMISVSLTIILISIIVFFIFRYRNIQSTYKNLLIDQRLNWIKLKPDYISNSLASMQEMIANKDPKSVRYLSKFSKLLRAILEHSRQPLIEISDEIQTIIFFLETHQLKEDRSFTFEVKSGNNLQDVEIDIPPMLIQPLLDIAIKNCESNEITAPKITIEITFKEHVLSCIILDNGLPLDASKKDIRAEIKKVKDLLYFFLKLLNSNTNLSFKYEDNHNKTTILLPYKIAT
ncbi:tetratricopeptide repeat protein [Tenacibaculum agarivorans]|uniref:tetratricopeptide repeat protein n=1 Tax=Tenacibaculum agarivorans TaxID=1908389 RepID=UPI000AF35DEC|nr:tetratricopeptide repeat protein [Tenacibaculum agarivorans]